jgi:hypothetical protein
VNHYFPATPHLASAIGAIAMTTAIFAVLVVLPSKMEPDSEVYVALAAVAAASRVPCAIIGSPACADTVAGDTRDALPPAVRHVTR